MAYQGHIVVPTTHEHSDHVIHAVGKNMDRRFGGHSEYSGEGAWMSDGEQLREDHVRLVATGTADNGFTKEWFRKEAEYVKDALDQDAVLVEIQEVDMMLV